MLCASMRPVRRSQFVKYVRDVPAAVDDADNLDDAGTLAVENEIVAVREHS